MCRKLLWYSALMLVFLIDHQQFLYAQKDTLQGSKLDSFLKNQKGVVGQLAQNLLTNKTDVQKGLQSNDWAFQQYRGRTIRGIIIKSLEFGISIGDTSKVLNNKLTRLANYIHWNTREKVISNNLFFRQNDKLSPFLFGDNEAYLRALPYIQDARIIVQPVEGSMDSVDILVLTKDVISIGGSFHMHNYQSVSITVREDNLRGLGDRFQLQMLYDQSRFKHVGNGFEYIKRNIGGSFIDGAAGYLNFEKAISSRRAEERMGYITFIKPMVHPYLRWTYGLEARLRASQNMYASDSFYTNYLKYKANSIDAWAALNTSAGHIAGKNEDDRLRTALSMRFLHQNFTEKPLQYSHQYYYLYPNMTAILGGAFIFKQNFYKVQYLYAFGRPEDVPEGVNASLTFGWISKDIRKRPYMAIDLQRFFFTRAEQYFDFTFQAESYYHKHQLEDATLLGRVEFINHLNNINSRWKQRMFLRAEIVKQYNGLLNEPVFPVKLYGTLDANNNPVGGDLRANISGESVFYSPWSILYFKLAPLVFGDVSLFRYTNEHSTKVELYPAIGGGVRFRNESLVFGTMDFRAWYFPKKNFYGEGLNFQFETKVRFDYNQKFIRRPEFIQIN
ncbi:hypothetical protein OCK74_06900 [Chitinophagaceae bacterium LB-8]|uniref:Haemolysin activator HlyB C-terminal domain-containing protein n=1 Tax=Paraflavisolibacter caeni TaxID=2982496 RepID=A0A9X2XTC9_9BACT|nr:hypothetical protein [Paraflavisolibacter caeni]MCU7548839.1 hypothetical protein [Paraflavisolibacter caeni]